MHMHKSNCLSLEKDLSPNKDQTQLLKTVAKNYTEITSYYIFASVFLGQNLLQNSLSNLHLKVFPIFKRNSPTQFVFKPSLKELFSSFSQFFHQKST